MRTVVNYKGKNISLNVKGTSYFTRGSGLMFKNRRTDNLLFDFKNEKRHIIHSYFVFFPFLAVWLDGENKVVETKVVEPFRLSVKPKSKFKRLIEIPLNEENKEIINFFVGD